MDMKLAIKKYAPIAARYQAVLTHCSPGGVWGGDLGFERFDMHIYDANLAGDLTDELLRDMSSGIKRTIKAAPVLAECLKRSADEFDVVMVGNGYNAKMKFYFCHNNKLRLITKKVHGVYSLRWGLLADVLEEMENIYSGP
tara:strand:- start:78 stop:500 length:423 start_codon:yes stop_codon:yes gene_type:complete